MTEPDIPFLLELRREFRRAAIAQTNETARQRCRRRRAWRLVPALLLVCAGAAAAKTLLFAPTPTTLVARGLQCTDGTDNAARSSVANVEPRGLTPTEACGKVLGIAAAKLVACYDARHGAVVYQADGAAGQCRRLKMSPLPAGYATATRRVNRLQDALNHVYDTHGCLTPAQLAARSQQILNRLGFVGWHTRLLTVHGSTSQGPCGQFPGIGNRPSDAAAALTRDDNVAIQNGPPRPIAALLNRQEPKLVAATGRSCQTTASAETIAQHAFAANGLSTLFAVTQEPTGEGFTAGRQTKYQHGCTASVSMATAPDGRTILVWLISRSARALPAGVSIPTLGMYRATK